MKLTREEKKMIHDACITHVAVNKMNPFMFRVLQPLAIKSYKNMPKEERKDWTLEQILIQGL